MLEPGCHVRHARFHPWSLVPTPPPTSPTLPHCITNTPTCIIDQTQPALLYTAFLLSVTYFGPNFSPVISCRQTIRPMQMFTFLIFCTSAITSSPWCYVCDSHHKFPSEPSASDNCHSSAFSGLARASTSSSATAPLLPVSHPERTLHIAHCTLYIAH